MHTGGKLSSVRNLPVFLGCECRRQISRYFVAFYSLVKKLILLRDEPELFKFLILQLFHLLGHFIFFVISTNLLLLGTEDDELVILHTPELAVYWATKSTISLHLLSCY